MRYSIENEFLKVTVDSLGAELVSVLDRKTGAEMIWQKDPKVWGRQAPVLFPYCGKLKGGKYTLDGKSYECPQHGFVRDYEHECVSAENGAMHFVFRSTEETLARFPRDFVFESFFTLDGRRLRHSVRVTNSGSRELRFGFGYHPGFAFPFDDKHTTEDYELRFDTPQTPVVKENEASGPNAGFVNGKTYPLVENSKVIPLSDRMFDNDSLCLSQMTAKTLSIAEKDSDRRVSLRIEGFPYVLLWSAVGTDTLRFLCIEPWHSVQDTVDATGDWNDKACAAQLQPGESWQTDLDITFDR